MLSDPPIFELGKNVDLNLLVVKFPILSPPGKRLLCGSGCLLEISKILKDTQTNSFFTCWFWFEGNRIILFSYFVSWVLIAEMKSTIQYYNAIRLWQWAVFNFFFWFFILKIIVQSFGAPPVRHYRHPGFSLIALAFGPLYMKCRSLQLSRRRSILGCCFLKILDFLKLKKYVN